MNPQQPGQTPIGFTIYTDNTATPPMTLPVNQDNPYILRPIASNSQQNTHLARLGASHYPVTRWMAVNTQPGDILSRGLFLEDPQQRAIATATQYPPLGQPVEVSQVPAGYLVNGQWHYQYLHDVYQQQQQRNNPDVNPMWSVRTFQAADAVYRNTNHTVPGIVWPSAASGMASNLDGFRAIESSGIHYLGVNPNGYINWYWNGTQ